MNRDLLIQNIQERQSYLCVGLDTDSTKLPNHIPATAEGMLFYNKAIIDATKDYCVAYKINTAFYEALGAEGWSVMEATFRYIPSTHFTIADAKRGDIGNTSHQYARAFFEVLGADAVTVAPYMGEDSIRPFLEYPNKWTIVLGLTSNVGANDFQRLKLSDGQSDQTMVPNLLQARRSRLLYEEVLTTVSSWGTIDNLMFVVGATQAAELAHIRQIIPNSFLLVPGVGTQGGSLQDVTKYGKNKDIGLLVNVSRAIQYASIGEDFAEAAEKAAKLYQSEMATLL